MPRVELPFYLSKMEWKNALLVILLFYAALSLLFSAVKLSKGNYKKIDNYVTLVFKSEDATIGNDETLAESVLSSPVPPLSATDRWRLPSNNSTVHIAFIGDSLTRYQYLNLAYFTHHGEWITNSAVPNLMSEGMFPSWNEYYRYAGMLLNETEQCDCYRPQGNYMAIRKMNQIHENRYYVSSPLSLSNNSTSITDATRYLTMIQKMGEFEAHGHWLPEEVYQPFHAINITVPDASGQRYAWRYKDWDSIVLEYLAKLVPKPQYVVLNAGLWPHDLHNASVIDALRRALDSSGMQGIYKTTTKEKSDLDTTVAAYEEYACKVLHHCLNLSWTGSLNKTDEHYVDQKHFTATVNRMFNEQLLQLIDQK
jgi:hypothetical protein